MTCSNCGERLVDEIDPDGVTVGGERYPFRRDSDHIACDSCGMLHRVSAVRAAAVAQGDLAPVPEVDETDMTEEERAIAEAIAQIRDINASSDRTEASDPDDD